MSIVEDALNGAQIIQDVYDGAPATKIGGRLPQKTGKPLFVRVGAGLQTSRGYALAMGEDGVKIYIAGIVPGGDTGRNVVLGFGNQARMRESAGFNWVSYLDAMTIFRDAVDANLRYYGGGEVEIYGHSAGGIIAEALARILVGAGTPMTQKRFITYGAPKPGYHGATVQEWPERRRYMAQGDPVPTVPSLVTTPTDLWMIVAGNHLLDLRRGVVATPWECVHGNGGIGLRQYSYRPAIDALVPVPADQILNEWIAGEREPVEAHSILNYRRLLTAALARGDDQAAVINQARMPPQPIPEVAVQPPDPGEIAPIQLVTPRIHQAVPPPPSIWRMDGPELTIDGRLAGRTTRRGGRRMNAAIDTSLLFHYRQITGSATWNVYLVGAEIGYFAKRSQARTFCRKGNSLLRYMSNGQWPALDFADAFNAWMQAASQPDGKYRPPLRVTF